MKVRILRDEMYGTFKVGKIADLHDSIARAWIKSGLAEAVDPQKAEKAPKEDFIPLNKRKKKE